VHLLSSKPPTPRQSFGSSRGWQRLRGFFEISRHVTDNLAVVAEVKTDLATGD